MMDTEKPATTVLRERGQVTIPADVRKAADVSEGSVLEFTVDRGRIVITPKVLIDADQAWFWTERWQRMERESDDDIAAGRTAAFGDIESLVADLDG